jgi:AraC-like DNA-binding protein
MSRQQTQNSDLYLAMARESRFQVHKMAQLLGISARQLQRDTQRFFGLTPLQWIRQQRLTPAGELLEKYQSARRVSLLLGFKQLSHFSREFKLFYGVPPQQYLNRSAKKRFLQKLKLIRAKGRASR